MAGDLAISAEILELVVDYITRKNQDGAHSEREVKVRIMFISSYLSVARVFSYVCHVMSYGSSYIQYYVFISLRSRKQ